MEKFTINGGMEGGFCDKGNRRRGNFVIKGGRKEESVINRMEEAEICDKQKGEGEIRDKRKVGRRCL